MWQALIGLLANKLMNSGNKEDPLASPMASMKNNMAGISAGVGREPYGSPQQPGMPEQPGGMFNKGFNVDAERWRQMQKLAQSMGGQGQQMPY